MQTHLQQGPQLQDTVVAMSTSRVSLQQWSQTLNVLQARCCVAPQSVGAHQRVALRNQ